MKNIKHIIGLFLLLLFMISCTKEKHDFGDIISPSNLTITAEITGQDGTNLYGDGSGEVTFTVSAMNAITYKFIYDGSEEIRPDGKMTYYFGDVGEQQYIVTAAAIGTGGLISSISDTVRVRVDYTPPADLLTMLTADASRTWRIKNEAWGHFGVGPATSDWQEWWGAGADDKAGKGAYDDRFTFNIDGTFTHVTNNTMYGKADPMAEDLAGDQGLTANGDGEYENYPYDDYTDEWALSAPGGVETLTFKNIGSCGFYVGGDHSYAIISRSENEMLLRTVGKGGLGWFVILIAE